MRMGKILDPPKILKVYILDLTGMVNPGVETSVGMSLTNYSANRSRRLHKIFFPRAAVCLRKQPQLPYMVIHFYIM